MKSTQVASEAKAIFVSSTAKMAKLFAKSHAQTALHATETDMPKAHDLYSRQGHLILQTMIEGSIIQHLPNSEVTHAEIEQALSALKERDANRVLFTERLKALDQTTAKEGGLERAKRLQETFAIVDNDVPRIFNVVLAEIKSSGKASDILDKIKTNAEKRIAEKERLLAKISTDRTPVANQLARIEQEYDTLKTLVSPKQLRQSEKGQAERKISAPTSGMK
ncbi:hypothetical protein AYO45_05975 [Gammaproteobacteria bacterium SCGC AG-212-F23]|nr:hypothetical protein AYO45_05975 [Gammaproteobacteria bacterium SCGC AG-212-F23]